MNKIGIIAGGGQFPILCAKKAKDLGYFVCGILHKNETSSEIINYCDEFVWLKLGQLEKLIETLKKWDINQVILAGTIEKKRIFFDVMPDLRALQLWKKLKNHHDDSILRAFASELLNEGIQVVSPAFILEELLATEGVYTLKEPTKDEWEDIKFGFNIAKEIGRHDIGQCVVVKDKCVLAVECIEGTDETIKRGAKLGREGVVVVKVCKPNQDLRFDLPTVGLKTIELLCSLKGSVLAIEAEKTLFFNKDDAIKLANQNGVKIVGLKC